MAVDVDWRGQCAHCTGGHRGGARPGAQFDSLEALRLVIGTLLLIFGLQWLRKAILPASGLKALHDEDAIYKRELAEARAAGREMRAGLDWYAYTVSFKGVLLEGLEVVFIVLPILAVGVFVLLSALAAVQVLRQYQRRPVATTS